MWAENRTDNEPERLCLQAATVRDLNQVNERLDRLQQEVLLAIPYPDAKPAATQPSKGHHASHAAVTTPTP
jgi:hypothetical protein